VGLTEDAIVDVSAPGKGGEVLIGGDYQGKNDAIKNAEVAFVGDRAQIFAHSTESGEGGKVIVWGDQISSHLGLIDVSGPYGGGFIGVSSPKNLCYRGRVDLSSKWGTPGELLLDPSDITVVSSGSSNPSFPTTPGNYNPPGVSSATLSIPDLQSGLNSGNVTISTSAGSGGLGTVLFDSVNLSWNASTKLTVLADGNIRISGSTIQNTHTGSGNFDAMDFNGNGVLQAGGISNRSGIYIQDTTFTSIEGNISFTGHSTLSGILIAGLFFDKPLAFATSLVSSTGTGPNSATIQLNGFTDGTFTTGTYLNFVTINSVDGDITISGSSTRGNSLIVSEFTTIASTGSGELLFRDLLPSGSLPAGIGIGGNAGAGMLNISSNTGNIEFQGNSFTTEDFLSVSSGTGDMIISANAFINRNTTGSFSSSGSLTIQTYGPGVSMGVGAAAGALRLTPTILDFFQNGFSERTFGRTDATGAVTVGNYTHPDPITIQSPLGSISVVGALATTGGDAIKLIADQMDFSSTITGTGTLTIEPGQATTSIGLGNSASGMLNLSTAEVSNITNGFSSITIGQTNQDSAVDIRAVTFQDPVTVNGKQISVNGAVSAGANNVNFNIGIASTGILNLNGLVTTTGTFQVLGGGFNDTFNIGVTGQTATVDGVGGTDNTIKGPNATNTWSLTAANTETLGSISFSNMQNVQGGSGNDTFDFGGPFQFTGTVGIDGGVAGTNVLNGPGLVTNWTIANVNQGFIYPTGAPGATPFTRIGSLVGGSLADNFAYNGGYHLTGSINGGGGTNDITGPNTPNVWTISGNNQGNLVPNVTGGTTNFSNIQTLTGGTLDDNFSFTTATAQITGGVDGAGGANSATSPNITTNWTITGDDLGTINPGVATTLTNVQTYTGGSGSDIFTFAGAHQLTGQIDGGTGTNNIIGPGLNTNWTVTANNTGTVDPGATGTKITNFTNVQELTGGALDDSFTFTTTTAQLTGTTGIDGGGGANTVTGPNFNTNWTVTGGDTGTINPGSGATTLTNIESFIGGTANDTFTFTGATSQLTAAVGIDGVAGANNVIGPNITTNWTITGDDQGTINPELATALTNIQTFTGNATNDTFTFTGANQLTGQIDGGLGTNNITGPGLNTNWTVTANNTGTVDPGATGTKITNFTNVQTLTGGALDDSFTFTTTTAQLTGTVGIDGGAGTNIVTGPDFDTNWTVTGGDTGTINPGSGATTLTNIESFIGGTANDTFTFTVAASQLTAAVGVDGGSGTNTITGTNTGNTWTVSSPTTGSIDPGGGATNYINVGVLNGGAGNDIFNVADGAVSPTPPPTVSAGGGANTLNFVAWTVPVTIDLNNITGFQVINATPGFNNTLIGNDDTNTWQITANDSGTLQNSTYPIAPFFSFSNFPNLQGGSGNDTFIFTGVFQLTGPVGIDGGTSGTNTITGTNTGNTWTVSSPTTGTIDAGGGATNYSNIGVLNGGAGNDIFNVADGAVSPTPPPTVSAGGGTNTLNFVAWTVPVTIDLNNITGFQVINATPGFNNTLIGNDDVNTWHITADESGTLENSTYPIAPFFSFSNFLNLQGGSGNDTFIFDGSFQVSSIQGAAGQNTINGPDADNTWAITTTNGGNLTSVGIASLITFTDIQNLIGGSSQDDFVLNNGTVSQVDGGLGTNSLTSLNSTWLITANDAGSVDGVAFINVGSLIGGSDDDSFVFSDGVTLSGLVDGGAPASGNTLDYTAYTTPATITLTGPTSGTATNLGSGFTNIGQFVGNYICTNCPTPPVPRRTFPSEKAKGLRSDLMLTLTKEIEYFEWNYDRILFYNIYKTVLNTVLVNEDLMQW